ncbi:DinB family protein [Homoserinimonas sp. A447]
MADTSEKAILHRYLRSGREAMLWKLDGLSHYDLRRPLVPTGTNLLGLVKHLAGVEAGYFGSTFGRPFPESLPWMDEDAEANADMWATADETPESIVDLYHRVAAHSDATIEELALDAPGRVAWWPDDRSTVTLQQILVHLIAETHRHAGHADIVRELIDGAAGLRKDNDNLPPGDRDWWVAYRARLDQVAREAGEGSQGGA